MRPKCIRELSPIGPSSLPVFEKGWRWWATLAIGSNRLPAVVHSLSAAAASAAVPAAATVFLRAGFIDGEAASIQLPAAQGFDGAVSIGIDTHFDKPKAFGAARIAVGYDVDALHRPVCLKHGSNRIFGGIEAEVSYNNILHLVSF